jgi:PAS domain S-box-containing protein
MQKNTRIDFHTHSVHSDGVLTPRELAETLAASGVVAAALADHNSVEGLEEFRLALSRFEIGFIPAVEITTHWQGKETHLLAYGFDTSHPELLATLQSLRQTHSPMAQNIAESIRTKGAHVSSEDANVMPDGRIDTADAITLVHRAGGRAFLAHPITDYPDFDRVESMVTTLKECGLDGIEAIYAAYSDEDQQKLCEIAERLGLVVSGGTDLHERNHLPGIEMPTKLWKKFRDLVCNGNAHIPVNIIPTTNRQRSRMKWRNYIFHFIFPTFIAISLFIGAIYAIFLPTFERSLLDRKRDMIRELTNSAWSILAAYERDERAGKLTRAQAQAMAISQIESLRYGKDGKDYFWLQDMYPHMIMHPYLKKLNGTDVSGFRDPRNVAIFVQFADLVRRGHEGYAQYVWQWNDDPSRLVPKESYIKGFQPWGWIIGTGIYIEDVKLEISRIERSLVRTSLVISIIVVLLLLYVMLETLRLEKERAAVVESLRESTERYRSLVEATTEGTLLVMDGRCRYANRTFLEMLGCTQSELEMLDLSDIFPNVKDNDTAWIQLKRLLDGDDPKGGFDGMLQRRNGTIVECVLIPSRISFAERSGFILLARNVAPVLDADDGHQQGWRHLQEVVNESPIGIFRARATSRGTMVAYNGAVTSLLVPAGNVESTQISLADIFPSSVQYDDFFAELQRNGSAERHLHISFNDLTSKAVAVNAMLIRDENNEARYIDGVIEDITEQDRHTADMEAQIERMQTSLLFLHQPIGTIGRSVVFCPLEMPIHTAAAMMTDHHASAALIQADGGTIVGIVTDGDIRQRVVSANISRNEPVYRIMSSPLTKISERAVIYEALLLMEQQQIQHLAVEDEGGRIVGVIRNQELMQFRNYGPIVLTREVEQAESPEDVVRSCRRVPGLAKALLDCGAHPHMITRMTSSVCNAATVRLIELAEREFGLSPTLYTFLSLGSQGRGEMTLSSDQDNAIIYQDPANIDDIATTEQYLNSISIFVCGWLNKAGYPLCKGNVLAQNPRWCRPLSAWKRYFSDWIERAEPQQLLEFTIFFDFAPIYGSDELTRELRQHLFAELREHPAFYPHFAQNALLFKPPTRMFGRVLGTSGELAGMLDLKDAVMPIVNFARLYALRHEIDATHTLDRLKLLVEKEVIPLSSCQEITEAYEFLMRLRLQQQAAVVISGQTPDNVINPRRLGQVEQTLVNQSFGQITAIQKRISYNFLGGMTQG